MMKKWLTFISVLALTLVIAACGANSEGNKKSEGGSSNAGSEAVDSGEAASSELVITAKNWEFDKEEYKIKAGETVDVTVKSAGGVHAVRILKTDYDIANKKTVAVKIDEPGTYDMICSVPCGTGHRTMVAKLIVE
ncbi:cytochrome C oxidase subunit II [Paenibacillus sp. GCM10027627]|uniref:cytochrome C oxidase subunit II n=1 Tax=unclassified Paenibacillus TaxID=185978 RepID=UPI00363B8B10